MGNTISCVIECRYDKKSKEACWWR